MPNNLISALHDFALSHNFLGQKGPLCVAIVITRAAIRQGLPLDSGALVTTARGQVQGLGKSAVQAILRDHGVTKILAAEGGRTSRGSMGNMQDYVKFLNEAREARDFDLQTVEEWWIARVKDYFEAAPLKLKVDTGASLKTCFQGVFDEATRRQAASPGATLVGAVMQHLVGAKLETLYPQLNIAHSGYSVADSPTGRSGDFEIGDCAIHVTTAPSELLLQKCSANLERGLRPVIISNTEGAVFADRLAADRGLQRRIEVLDIHQFLVANVLEWTAFEGARRRTKFEELVNNYNRIVGECETDPSLRIEVA